MPTTAVAGEKLRPWCRRPAIKGRKSSEGSGGYFDSVGDTIKRRTLDKGLLLRPLGNTIYFMPPYSLTDDERQSMYDGTLELVEEVVGS